MDVLVQVNLWADTACCEMLVLADAVRCVSVEADALALVWAERKKRNKTCTPKHMFDQEQNN